MKNIQNLNWIRYVCSGLLLTVLSGCSGEAPSVTAIARGSHLVNNVAKCQDCHSPRIEGGAFDPESPLAGSILGFAPLVEMPWAPVAPPIAGLPSLTDEEAVVFFTTGRLPQDRKLNPPMPEYRFTQTEAEAVVAYLRSLNR